MRFLEIQKDSQGEYIVKVGHSGEMADRIEKFVKENPGYFK